jgi:hypothetical protein
MSGQRLRRATLLAVAAVMVLCGEAEAGSSAQFAGAGTYASTPDASTFDFPGSFTIELWFQSDTVHAGTLLAKFRQASGTPLDDSYYLSVRDDDTLQARIQTTLQLVDLKAAGAIHDGQWHHVVLVFDHPAERAELYLDGSLGASQPLTGNLRDTGERVTLGCVLSGSGAPVPTSFFRGRIDEPRFWNIARRNEQAWCLKDVSLLHDTPGLVSYYGFNEGSGNVAADAVAPYETFTLLNGAVFSPAEPALRSRLSGPGQCRCGEVSGVFDSGDPALTLVGDTVTVPAGDSLVLTSHSLTADSTVSVVRVLGKLRAQGNIGDSSRILGQGSPAADAVIELLGPSATLLSYTRVSGFASVPLRFFTALNIANALFSNNTGGALRGRGTLTVSDANFVSNGGTAVRMDSGNVTIERAEFLSNGAGLFSGNGNLLLDSVTFTGNGTVDSGGAVAVNLSTDTRAQITNCIFTGNAAVRGGALFATGELAGAAGDSLILAGCTFRQNTADSGAAVWARNVNLLLEQCDFDSNAADVGGGVMALARSGGVCRVRGDSLNFAHNQGGEGSALWLCGAAGAPVEMRVAASTFSSNLRAALPGACVMARKLRGISGAGPVLERCLFHDNENSGGAASAADFSEAFDSTPVELRTLTAVLNVSDSAAVLVRVPAVLRHCIVIENGGAREILGNSPAVAYCLTSDIEYHGAGGSFYADPAFADYWGRDFHLTAGSPAINRGDPNSLYNDPGGTRADIGCYVADPFPPQWQSISDVPHDNGRQLMLQWLPSSGDDGRHGIATYSIYRVVNLGRLDENYELMATIPAAQLAGYGQIVPTLADSNAQGVPHYGFFVRAQSVNALAFWDTPLDSGYSVDNLAPGSPLLSGQEAAGGVALEWTAAPDSDLAFYRVYRSDSPFDPDTATTAFATRLDTTLFDSVESGTWHYAVRSVDRNGNASDPSNVVAVDVGVVSAPQGLTIMPEGDWLMLRWQPVPAATDYRVFRASAFNGPEEVIGTTGDTFFLTPLLSTHAFYWVTAER